NIKINFHVINIYPFLSFKLLNSSPSINSKSKQNSSSSSSSITFFTQSMLINSQMNLQDIHKANLILHHLIHATNSIFNEEKRYFNYFIQTSNKLRAEKSFL